MVSLLGSFVGMGPTSEAMARHGPCSSAGAAPITFAQADFNTFMPEGKFDAVIGRLVLTYLPDIPGLLRRLAALLSLSSSQAPDQLAARGVKALALSNR